MKSLFQHLVLTTAFAFCVHLGSSSDVECGAWRELPSPPLSSAGAFGWGAPSYRYIWVEDDKIVYGDDVDGLFHSLDFGRTWKETDRAEGLHAIHVQNNGKIFYANKEDEVLMVDASNWSTPGSLYVVPNDHKRNSTLSPVTGISGYDDALFIAAGSSSLTSLKGGLLTTVDNGHTWSVKIDTLLLSDVQVVRPALSPVYPPPVYAYGRSSLMLVVTLHVGFASYDGANKFKSHIFMTAPKSARVVPSNGAVLFVSDSDSSKDGLLRTTHQLGIKTFLKAADGLPADASLHLSGATSAGTSIFLGSAEEDKGILFSYRDGAPDSWSILDNPVDASGSTVGPLYFDPSSERLLAGFLKDDVLRLFYKECPGAGTTSTTTTTEPTTVETTHAGSFASKIKFWTSTLVLCATIPMFVHY